MHPVKIHAKKRRTVLALVLALGVGLPRRRRRIYWTSRLPRSIRGSCISYAGGYPSGPPLVGSNLKVIDAIRMGDLKRQLSPTITPPNKILHFQTGPLVDYFSNVSSATSVWLLGGISPQGSTTLQGGIPSLNMPDGTTLLSGSLRTARVTEPAPVSEDSFFYAAGSNFTDNKNDGLLASFGISSPDCQR